MNFRKSTTVIQELAVFVFKNHSDGEPLKTDSKQVLLCSLVAMYLLALLCTSVCMRLSALDHLVSSCYLPVCGKPVYVTSQLPVIKT